MRLTHRRRGNILMVIAVLVMLSLIITSLFSITLSQQNLAREKAKDAGNTNSYIALANMCADAFRCDFESLVWRRNIASVEDPLGTMDFGIEIYDEAIAQFQEAMTYGEAEEDEDTSPSWRYTLTVPMDAAEYAGIGHAEARRYIQDLLEDARVIIIVQDALHVYTENEDIPALANGDSVSVGDINFTLQMIKGTWFIEQSYCLSGEQLVGRYNDAQARFSVDGTEAECRLVRQTVSRRTVNTGYGDTEEN